MPIIATEAQAKSIGGSSASVTTNLMVTRVRAVALGCSIRNSYSDKQLVCLRDLYRVYCTGDCDNHQYACSTVGCVGDCSNCTCQSSNCTCDTTCECTGGHWSSQKCTCDTTCSCTGGHCDCNTTCSCTSTCNCTTTGGSTTCTSNQCKCTSTGCDCTSWCACNKHVAGIGNCASEFCQGNTCSRTGSHIVKCDCYSQYYSCAQNSAAPCSYNEVFGVCNYNMDYCWDGSCNPVGPQSCFGVSGSMQNCYCYTNVPCAGYVLECSCNSQCSCASGGNCSCESKCDCETGNCSCVSVNSCPSQCDCESECTGHCSNCQPNSCVGDCSGNHQYACNVVGCVGDGTGSTYKCTCHTTCDCTGGHWSSSYCSCDNTCSCQTACSNCPSNEG